MVGVLLITHGRTGEDLLAAAWHVLGGEQGHARSIAVAPGDDAGATLEIARADLAALDDGDGVIVFTDIFGATPCNIAQRLGSLGFRTHCVSGLNLPMLLRVLNYPEQDLDQLAQTAANGGRCGICIDQA